MTYFFLPLTMPPRFILVIGLFAIILPPPVLGRPIQDIHFCSIALTRALYSAALSPGFLGPGLMMSKLLVDGG